MVFLRTPAIIRYSTYQGIVPFVFLFAGSVTLALFFGVLLPLYGPLSRTLQQVYRQNGICIARRLLRLAGSTLISYTVCLVLSRIGVSPSLATQTGLLVLIIFESGQARELISTIGLRLIPETAYPYLIVKTSPNTKNTPSGPVLVATTRKTLKYHSTAFIAVKRLADEDRDRRKIRDILLGLHEAKINLGYTLNFENEFTILYSTTASSYSRKHAKEEAARRATILQHVLRSQLAKSEIQIIQTEHELPVQTSAQQRIRILNDTARIETDQATHYIGATQIEEIAGYSGSPAPLFEAILKLNLPTTYQVYAEPAQTPLQELWNTTPHSTPQPKTREKEEHSQQEKTREPRQRYKISAQIILEADDKNTLNIALESISAVARTALAREHTTIKTTRAKGLNLLKTINSTNTHTPRGPYQLLTPDEATTAIQFPSTELPGITAKTQPKLALPEKTEEPEVLELGETLRNGNPTGRPALIPTRNLTGHTLILGSTRSGKSHLTKHLLKQILEKTEHNFLVFDPHNEYSEIQSASRQATTIDPTREGTAINLLQPPSDVHRDNPAEFSQFIENTIATIRITFGGDWGPILDGLAHKSLYDLYAKNPNPTITDWLEEARNTAKEGDQRTRAALDSLTARLTKMTTGIYGTLFNQPKTTLDIQELVSNPTILNLSNLDEDAQRFLTSLLLKLILDHRKKNGPAEKTHIIVLEEAHNFAPRIYHATSSADEMSRNQAQKHLAELAKFNQAMILIDQRPSRITEDAIANCNTIITFHLQQQDDKNAVIAALGYSPYDPEGRQLSAYLSTFTTGHAIVKTQNSPYPYEIRTTPPQQPNPTQEKEGET